MQKALLGILSICLATILESSQDCSPNSEFKKNSELVNRIFNEAQKFVVPTLYH